MLGAGVWIAVAVVLAGAAIGYLFVGSVERGARADLSATMARLVALVDAGAAGDSPALTGALPDARYDTPLAGVYWQVTDLDRGGIARSRSLWDHVLTIDAVRGDRFVTTEGPADQSLLAAARTIRFPSDEGTRRYQVVVAQDRSILDETIERFGRELAVALLILGLMLVLAAILQVQLGLSPLGKLRADVEMVRKGTTTSVNSKYPTEVLPLVTEVNELLAAQRKAMEFARSRAADLAHGLKTPLAVLGTLEQELQRRGDIGNAGLIAELTAEMHDRIDYQMRLVGLNQRARLHSLSASPARAVERTASVLRKTRMGERLGWTIDVDPEIQFDIEENDLVELVGVVLENAAKWADAAIRVRVAGSGAKAELRIEDDGPGISPSELNGIGVRGRRLDETMPGTGLGLAIAGEIVALNGGTLTFERSTLGGLCVRIELPLAPSSHPSS
ncbi:sensor histidine kinase [Aureimonas sp. ME7]|uniref:sensor histidine kinase n=1 Tax=Aureimonas sp. ME7 TaxID=2744252 RepID=UPI001FCEFA23|nr:sensor histidine kinase [Aureimonas sp. ME7]